MSDESKPGTPTNPAPLEDHPQFHGAEAPTPKDTTATAVAIVVANSPVWKPKKGNFTPDIFDKARADKDVNALTFDQPIAHPHVAEALRLVKLSGDKKTVTVRSTNTGAQMDFSTSEVFDPRIAEKLAEALDTAAPAPSAPPPPTGPASRPPIKPVVTAIIAALLFGFGWAGAGCIATSGQPNTSAVSVSAQTADQIVLDAEKTAKIAHDTFKEFLQLDLRYRDIVVQYVPAAHKFAEKLRAREPDASKPPNMIKWVQSLRTATMVFDNSRTADNRAGLTTALSVVNNALAQSRQYIADINARKGQ